MSKEEAKEGKSSNGAAKVPIAWTASIPWAQHRGEIAEVEGAAHERRTNTSTARWSRHQLEFATDSDGAGKAEGECHSVHAIGSAIDPERKQDIPGEVKK